MSALPPCSLVQRALSRSERLYQVFSQATAVIIVIPQKAARKCRPRPAEVSMRMKYPTNARNTPRQKISSECCPHRINGRSQRDFSPGHPGGTHRTVIAASAAKCANLRISRSVLLMGYIHCSSRRGIKKPSWGKYHVIVIE